MQVSYPVDLGLRFKRFRQQPFGEAHDGRSTNDIPPELQLKGIGRRNMLRQRKRMNNCALNKVTEHERQITNQKAHVLLNGIKSQSRIGVIHLPVRAALPMTKLFKPVDPTGFVSLLQLGL